MSECVLISMEYVFVLPLRLAMNVLKMTKMITKKKMTTRKTTITNAHVLWNSYCYVNCAVLAFTYCQVNFIVLMTCVCYFCVYVIVVMMQDECYYYCYCHYYYALHVSFYIILIMRSIASSRVQLSIFDLIIFLHSFYFAALMCLTTLTKKLK